MKLQYFCFRGKTKHIRRTSRRRPCVAPGCGRVIPGVETRRGSSPYTPESRGLSESDGRRRGRTGGGRGRTSGAEPHQWGRSHTAAVPVGGGSRTRSSSVSSPFRLTSQLCAGQKVVLYRRYLTVPLFFFFFFFFTNFPPWVSL